MVGAEVLLRWNSETLGPVAPDEFIPLTEQTGLIIPIGRWVLLEACKQAKTWMDQGHPNFRLSVNVSPRQFRGNDFVADLAYALETSRFPARLLTLEVTEGLLIQTTQTLEDTLQSIVSMGISISMDDFGTGYSSLSYLKTFPFNNLKIDRSFINELNTNNDAMILVTATIAMAHELGLTVTAEGIETAEQLAILNSKHCDYLQGYLLAKPMDSASFQTTFFT
jgi:EAL domain-containing protein (putative c-di-GMP-specific phosphodiesterase class I)